MRPLRGVYDTNTAEHFTLSIHVAQSTERVPDAMTWAVEVWPDTVHRFHVLEDVDGKENVIADLQS
jgi:hypothetical protein